MVLNMCPTNVSGDRSFSNKDTDHKSHPYNKYIEIYSDWHIPPDPGAKDHVYWKWFVGQHIHSLAEHFDLKEPVIPDAWTEIKWEDVESKLMAQFNL